MCDTFQIRFHLVRCYVSLGDVAMFYCITEDMIADIFTKILAGAQDQRLSLRFYSLFPGSDNIILGFAPVPSSTELDLIEFGFEGGDLLFELLLRGGD